MSKNLNTEARARLRLRDRIITGTYAIGTIGKEPTDWKDYAIKLETHISKLELVMIAAAEEIQEHWQAHCDEEGYGPSNLMHRLENCVAANYDGYKSGQFTKLQERLKAAEKVIHYYTQTTGDDGTERLKALERFNELMSRGGGV